jgi:L-alanine-DL-glutamate epimerase-like enolase superfamily enzyme
VILVELDEGGGRVSHGEGCQDPFFGESPDALERDIRSALALLPDDPADLTTVRERLDAQFPNGGAAAAAIDILAHDRAAQAAGVPLRTLLGLAEAFTPSTSFGIGIADPSVMGERAAAAAARGFDILKVKLGQGDEVAILTAIRENFAGTLRVDPNAAWTPDEALARIEDIARFGIEFVEQPVAPDDIAGMKYVRDRSAVPIVADEAAVRLADVDRLAGACDGINVKLQKSGGIAEAREMVSRAHAHGLKVMLGCRAGETSISIAAAAHLAPAVEWADLDGNLYILDDPFIAVEVEHGRFQFADRPGLGAIPRTPASLAH